MPFLLIGCIGAVYSAPRLRQRSANLRRCSRRLYQLAQYPSRCQRQCRQMRDAQTHFWMGLRPPSIAAVANARVVRWGRPVRTTTTVKRARVSAMSAFHHRARPRRRHPRPCRPRRRRPRFRWLCHRHFRLPRPRPHPPRHQPSHGIYQSLDLLVVPPRETSTTFTRRLGPLLTADGTTRARPKAPSYILTKTVTAQALPTVGCLTTLAPWCRPLRNMTSTERGVANPLDAY